MSQFIGAFEVSSKLSGQTIRAASRICGTACDAACGHDRHEFFVDGGALVVGLAHTSFVKFRERAGARLTDREASFIAAEYLRERSRRMICARSTTCRRAKFCG